MTVPALLFALLVALLYGALYHFVRGGGFGRLLLFFILSMIGFVLGHLVGLWRGWVWIPLGSVNLGPRHRRKPDHPDPWRLAEPLRSGATGKV
jgi:hypothetical protein